MKTRTLLLLAVSCGLIILIAGSIKLFLVSDATAPAHLALGTATTIGDMTVSVESFEQQTEFVVVTVTLVGVDDEDGAKPWLFGDGNVLVEPSKVSEIQPACKVTKKTELVRCKLAFRSASGQGVLTYSRAGEVRRWDIVNG